MFIMTMTVLSQWFNPEINSDSFNQGIGDMIGSFLGALFSLVQPLFAAVGFLVILYVLIRAAFRRRR